MILNSITQKRGYALIYYDEGRCLLTDKKLAAKLEINEPFDLTLLLKENELFATNFSEQLALSYLLKFPCSEKKLKEYLLGKGIQKRAVETTLQKLKDYHYLNDEAFAEYFTQSCIEQGKGEKYIRRKLKEKGIGDELSQKALGLYSKEEQNENAKRFLESKNRSLKKYPPAIRKEKLYRSGIQAGFSSSDVVKTVNELINQDNNDFDDYYIPLINKKIYALQKKGLTDREINQKIMAEFRKKGAEQALIRKCLDEAENRN